MTSFLQTQAWANFQKATGRKVFEVEGTHIIEHALPFGKNYLYVPYADTAPDLRELALQEQSIFVKVEPLYDDLARGLIHQGYQRSAKTIQPHKTVLLDLMRSEEELLGAMHHKTRYNIRVAEREHIVVEQSDKTGIFIDLMKKTTTRDKFNAHPGFYYHRLLASHQLNTKLWIAWHEERPIAAAITLTHGDAAYYLHGASDYEHRALMGPYLLHWRIIHEFQALGSRFYDLWGIDAQKWPGITRFKLGWGGRTVEYPGAFDLAISKPWKFAYDLVQTLKM